MATGVRGHLSRCTQQLGERGGDAGVSLLSAFLFRVLPRLKGWCHPHSGWHFPSQLTQICLLGDLRSVELTIDMNHRA